MVTRLFSAPKPKGSLLEWRGFTTVKGAVVTVWEQGRIGPSVGKHQCRQGERVWRSWWLEGCTQSTENRACTRLRNKDTS